MPFEDTAALEPPVELSQLVQRLRHVTGFVTVLGPPEDRRAEVFARYYHVRRVAWTARLLARNAPRTEPIDQQLVNWLAWAHDLNRWPFAHNSEKGLFDQAANLPSYLARHRVAASPSRVAQVQAVVDKRLPSLGCEGRIVLLADIVAGFVEDPLWLTAALNVRPDIVPDAIVDYLCLPLRDRASLLRVHALQRTFRPSVDPDLYAQAFDALYCRVVEEFCEARALAAAGALESPEFQRARRTIKEQFMRGVVFPINNEKVSRGSLLKRELILPLMNSLGPGFQDQATEMTDGMFVDLAIRSGLAPGPRERYGPLLDYVEQSEPALSLDSYLTTLQDQP